MSRGRHTSFAPRTFTFDRRFRGSPQVIPTAHSLMRERMNQNYVPPYDRREQHLPGMNYCGPGTNVRRRLANKVQPIDALDKLCLDHDIWTEPRGPYRSRGKRKLLRSADRRLLASTKKLISGGYEPLWKALVVENAMELLLEFGGRGR